MAHRSRSAWTVLAVAALLLLAGFELQRVAAGRLFLVSLPWDAAASRVELIDAQRTARAFFYPALIVLTGIGLLAFSLLRSTRGAAERPALAGWLLVLFAVATLADLATTLWFFHARGIDHEVHPAIRLFGYAYGRTVGPVLGKLLQSLGVLVLAVYLPRGGKWLVLAAVVLYLGAALVNLVLM